MYNWKLKLLKVLVTDISISSTKSLLLIFSSIIISRIRRYVYAYVRMLILECKERAFIEKNELQMFLLISGGHIGAPKRYINMASPYKVLQRCVKRFAK